MTSTVTVSIRPTAPRHRDDTRPVKYGPRKIRAAARAVVTHAALTALASRVHLTTQETQR